MRGDGRLIVRRVEALLIADMEVLMFWLSVKRARARSQSSVAPREMAEDARELAAGDRSGRVFCFGS